MTTDPVYPPTMTIRPTARPFALATIATLAALLLAIPSAIASNPEPKHPRTELRDVQLPAGVPEPDTELGEAFRFSLAMLLGQVEPEDEVLRARFAESFLNAVPPGDLRRSCRVIREQILSPGQTPELRLVQAGARTVVVDLDGPAMLVRSRVTVGLDDKDRIDTFFLGPAPAPLPTDDTWAKFDADLDALHGTVNFGLYELLEGDELRTIREREPEADLALGSTFKLWVLLATAEAVREGELAWDQMLPIREALKSLPSGDMRNEPDGAEFPVAFHALRMIEVSDNTATDHLMHAAGRERVHEVMARFCAQPERNTPFLTTREMFSLKLGGDWEMRTRYAEAAPEERQAMLDAGLPEPNLGMVAFWRGPVHIDTIEWFARPIEIARTLAALDAIAEEPGMEAVAKALRTNAGIPIDRNAFPVIGFKGGSEPGVLNLSWSVRRADGRRFVLSLGWNDTERSVDTEAFIKLAMRAFALLAEME